MTNKKKHCLCLFIIEGDIINIQKLAKWITYLVQNNNDVLGHAIFKGRDNSDNLSEKILREGLRVEDESQGLRFTSRSFESTYQECLENIRDLSISSDGHVIIIAIPRYLLTNYDSQLFSSYDSSSILLEPTGETSNLYKDIDGNPTKVAILPSIYILGYFDGKQDLFIENPRYAFSNNIDISNLKLNLDKKYEEMQKEYQIELQKKL